MRGHLARLALWVFPVLFTLPVDAQRKVLRGGLVVESLSPPYSETAISGAAELRFRVTNISSTRVDTVSIEFPDRPWRGHQSRGMAVTEQVRRSTGPIEPSESRIVSLTLPDAQVYGNSRARVRYRGLQDVVVTPDLRYPGHTFGRSPVAPALLVSHSLKHRALQGCLSPSNMDEGVVKHEVGMSEWSPNWEAYARFDGLVLAQIDYENLPDPARDAVHRYVELGGSLAVIGEVSFPSAWEKGPGMKDAEVFVGGFGSALQTDQDFSKSGFWQSMNGKFWQPAKSRRQAAALSSLESSSRVKENLDIPVLGLFLLMLAFATIIGPVNLWFLRKRNKRIWMLWTVPAISAITCGIVFVYSLFKEGITPSRATASFTLLDQESGRAATLGSLGVYAPLTPGRGFRFPHGTEVRPMSPGSSTGQVTLDTDQHFNRGWALARVPVYFQLRRSETTKLRLEVGSIDPAKGVEVVNGFGHAIRQVLLADDAGNLYEATDIPAGAKATIAPTAPWKSAAFQRPSFASEFTLNQLSSLAPDGPVLKQFMRNQLRQNSYVLQLEGNPMIPRGIKGKTISNTCIIQGRFVPKGGQP